MAEHREQEPSMQGGTFPTQRTRAVGPGSLQCGARATCTLDPSLRAPGQARRFVEERICSEHGALASVAVALAASELVTHAVLHGEGPVTLALECGATSLRLSVACRVPDAAEGPELRLGDAISTMIVHSICRAAGTERTDLGPTMWCTIPTGYLPAPAAPREEGSSPGGRAPTASRPRTSLRRLPHGREDSESGLRQ